MPLPAARHPVAQLCACVLLALATLTTACSSQSAPPPSTATIPLQFDNDQQVVPSSNPTVDSSASVAPSATDTNADADGSEQAEADDHAATDPAPAADALPRPASGPLPMSDQGVALGCTDATELRRWLGTTAEPVATIATTMPDQVWLCPQSPDVIAQLDCFPNETSAILVELAIELGSDVDDIVNQISSSNTAFCASGDVIRLGIDDILDQIDDP